MKRTLAFVGLDSAVYAESVGSLALQAWWRHRCLVLRRAAAMALRSLLHEAAARLSPSSSLFRFVSGQPNSAQRRQEADVILFWMEQWPFWLLLVVSSVSVKQLRNGRL